MADLSLPSQAASSTLPLQERGGAAATGNMASWLERQNGPLSKVGSFMQQPAVVRAMPALIGLAAISAVALAWVMLAQPASRSLFPQASDAERSQMVETLNASGIGYSIDPSTGIINVSETDYHRARMTLASEGLPRSAPAMGEMMGSIPLGSSRAVELERIRDARQTDLARTIEQIDIVNSARVHIAENTPSAFVRDNAEPAASVMLTLAPGRSLSDSQVQAIVNLVASSVPGLSTDKVAVVDQMGKLLSQQGGLGSSAAERQLAVKRQMEEDYLRSLNHLLTPVLGEGNFTADVNVDLDFSDIQSTREGVPADPAALLTEERQLSTDQSATAEGIPGTISNTPPEATVVAEAPVAVPAEALASGRRTENYSRRFALGREVSVTRQQSPSLARITVAVAVKANANGARSAGEMQQLESLIKGAVGFNEARGDVVALSARPFVAQPTESETWWQASWMPLVARNLTAALIAAMLIFGLFWPLYKRRSKRAAERKAEETISLLTTNLPRSGGALPASSDAGATPTVTVEMIRATHGYEARAKLIRQFVAQDPARAALVVRDLIKSDVERSGGSNG